MNQFAAVLRIQGATRSWGSPGIGDDRLSYQAPTKSAILGMLGACCGLRFSDKDALDIWFSSWDVVSCSSKNYMIGNHDIQTQILHDFQATNNAMEMSGKIAKHASLGSSAYLTQTQEAVLLKLKNTCYPEMGEFLKKGCQNPVFTPYLGRRSNIFSEPLWFDGSEVSDLTSSMQIEALINSTCTSAMSNVEKVFQNLVIESHPGAIDEWLKNQSNQTTITIEQRSDLRHGHKKMYANRNVQVCRFQKLKPSI